ncbi:MAG: GAF domain-containing protein [Bernardetiaceae bacterium]|nr:GAF domain-containing protein [Bernardetiaceae bacterium]
MIAAPKPQDEQARLAALLEYEILDTEAEEEFDNLVKLASQICDAKISLVSLIDAERQWFKARKGLGATETPRELAFCAHAILQDGIFEVENALEDERFHDNPLVTDNPDIRFYAGMPLATPSGHKIGTLCVIDVVPKKLTEAQRFALKTLGEQVIAQLELKLKLRDLQERMRQVKKAQAQIIQSEKMATLGQLIANIAHEINTPLGAIKASSENAKLALDSFTQNLPEFVQNIETEHRPLFEQLITISMQANPPVLSTKEARQLKYELIDKLANADIQISSSIAELLIHTGLHKQDVENLHFLKDQKGIEMLKKVAHLIQVFKSNSTIQEATTRAAKVIFAIKTFARQDLMQTATALVVNDNIDNVLTIYQHHFNQNIQLEKQWGDIPKIEGYPDELVQVWTNIIYNAIQAMQNQGKLTISTYNHEGKVRVAISDTGTGIPNEIKDKIFEPFFTSKGLGEGSGLGLDICRTIIEKHKGSISFESEEGKGTTFFVDLPLTFNQEELQTT